MENRGYAQNGNHIVHFGWEPFAGIFAISAILSSSLIGWLLTNGGRLSDSSVKGFRFFLFLLSVQTVAYLGLVVWTAVRKIAGMNREEPAPQKPRRGRRDRVLAINTGGETPPRSLGQKMQDRIAEVREAQRARSKAPAQGTMMLEAKVQEPEYTLEEELYDVTHHMYSKPLTRASFEDEYEGGQGVYAQYKDHWTNVGWVDVDGKGTMTFKFSERDLYWNDRRLRGWAKSKGFDFTPPLPH